MPQSPSVLWPETMNFTVALPSTSAMRSAPGTIRVMVLAHAAGANARANAVNATSEDRVMMGSLRVSTYDTLPTRHILYAGALRRACLDDFAERGAPLQILDSM